MVPGQMAEGLARRISANAEELGGELNAALSTSSWSLSSSSSSASSGPGDRRREDEPSFDPTQAVQTMLDPNHMPTACKVVGSHVENVGPILKLKVVYNGDVTGRELNVPRATMLSALDALESRRTTEECEKDCSGNLSRQLSAIHDNIANDDLETKGTARQMLESVFPSRFPSSFAGRMVAGGLLLSAVVAVIVISVILGQNSDLSSPETTSAPRPTPSFEVDEDGIVTRRGWGALPRRCTVQDLVTPVEYVIIGHTVTDQCNDRPSCATQVRNVQSYHQNIPEIECDIGYNFLVGGDGRVYAGRGWTNVGAHTYNFNQRSIGIAFVGEFTTLHPPEDALRAARALIDAGVQRKYVRPDYKVRNIQSYHQGFSKNFCDIGYNFLVGGDGKAYLGVGNGWKQAAEGVKDLNYRLRSFVMSFIGNYMFKLPSAKQMSTAKKLIDKGVRLQMIAADHKLLGHCQISKTQSPGRALYQEIQTWDHWTDMPLNYCFE